MWIKNKIGNGSSLIQVLTKMGKTNNSRKPPPWPSRQTQIQQLHLNTGNRTWAWGGTWHWPAPRRTQWTRYREARCSRWGHRCPCPVALPPRRWWCSGWGQDRCVPDPLYCACPWVASQRTLRGCARTWGKRGWVQRRKWRFRHLICITYRCAKSLIQYRCRNLLIYEVAAFYKT